MKNSRSPLWVAALAAGVAVLVLWMAWPSPVLEKQEKPGQVRSSTENEGASGFGPGESLAGEPSKPEPVETLAGAEVMQAIARANPKPVAEPGSELPVQLDEQVTTGGLAQFPEPGPPLRIQEGKPIPELFPHQKERITIETLASTYDVASIPALAGYLDHADPMVRDAARLGLIQLSRPEAAPVLRAAAKRVKDANEAAALIEAAEFLASVASS